MTQHWIKKLASLPVTVRFRRDDRNQDEVQPLSEIRSDLLHRMFRHASGSAYSFSDISWIPTSSCLGGVPSSVSLAWFCPTPTNNTIWLFLIGFKWAEIFHKTAECGTWSPHTPRLFVRWMVRRWCPKYSGERREHENNEAHIYQFVSCQYITTG